MYINPIAANNIKDVKARKKAGSSSNFAEMVEDVAASSSAPMSSGAAPVSAAGAIFALQEVDNEIKGREQAINDTRDILEELDKLKIDLLSGQISPQRLDRISQLVLNHKNTTDPALLDIIAQIELRAQVELAKLGRS